MEKKSEVKHGVFDKKSDDPFARESLTLLLVVCSPSLSLACAEKLTSARALDLFDVGTRTQMDHSDTRVERARALALWLLVY